jgi:hypothetical protein
MAHAASLCYICAGNVDQVRAAEVQQGVFAELNSARACVWKCLRGSLCNICAGNVD